MSAELSTIYANIQTVLDIRHKYLDVSLQNHGNNPKDHPSWNIYPPPPPPVWIDESDRKQSEPAAAKEQTGKEAEKSFWIGTDRHHKGDGARKPGHDVGSDFDIDKCEIPGADDYTFGLDDGGIYQIFESEADEGMLRCQSPSAQNS